MPIVRILLLLLLLVPLQLQPAPAAARSPDSFSWSERTVEWGNPQTLDSHFRRHGADLGAADRRAYVAMAASLLRRAGPERLPTKLAGNGTIRIWDPQTGQFGAYNRDGSIRTLFLVRDPAYFARQPGRFRGVMPR
jgi:pyocin large subunit-like protein